MVGGVFYEKQGTGGVFDACNICTICVCMGLYVYEYISVSWTCVQKMMELLLNANERLIRMQGIF